MSFWAEVANQADAIAQLESVLRGDADQHHAWLITGPPGSGRINLAHRFAAAIIAESNTDEARDKAFKLVKTGNHPDVTLISTAATQLDVGVMREAVRTAYFAPSVAKRRVIVIEDADRMNAQAANATLKALEEPPETTIWILCAPSINDLLPTIASRTRLLRLRMPKAEEIANLLFTRDGVPLEDGLRAARHAQNHIGMARKLAASEEARQRRELTVLEPLKISGIAHAMHVARQLTALAEEDAQIMLAEQGESEREALRRQIGDTTDRKVLASFNSQFKALEEDLKRRETRALRDGVDRLLVDLLTVARDVLMVKVGGTQQLINEEYIQHIKEFADSLSLEQALGMVDRYERARFLLGQNVSYKLILESAFAGQVAEG